MIEEKDFINRRISVLIPNYNAASTIGQCLEAAFSSDYDNFEVIVVDDASSDNSVEIIKQFPCKLIRLDKNSGASKTRNIAAENSSGEILFFIDADCLLQRDTLDAVNKTYPSPKPLPQGEGAMGRVIIGGTYTKIPYDNSFFGTFQSIFINYSETKKKEPDYIAAHAMIIDSKVFKESGGFPEKFLPIIEDVEFSHRLRRAGYKLKINPEILVQHIFNFTLIKSLKNAFRKSKYWTIYSLKNKDLFRDSGTASVELKIDVASFFLTTAFLLFPLFTLNIVPIGLIVITQTINLYTSRNLIKAFFNTKGLTFGIAAAFYYTIIYPFAVGIGAISGIMHYLKMK